MTDVTNPATPATGEGATPGPAGATRVPRTLTSRSGGMTRVRRKWTGPEDKKLVKFCRYRCWSTLEKMLHRPRKAIGQRIAILKRQGRIQEGVTPPRNSLHFPEARQAPARQAPARDAAPALHHGSWTDDEENLLRVYCVVQRLSPSQISVRMGRSELSIKMKMRQMRFFLSDRDAPPAPVPGRLRSSRNQELIISIAGRIVANRAERKRIDEEREKLDDELSRALTQSGGER